MRIAVFAKRTTFHEGYGGLETQNKILCEGLASRGHEITVFSPNWTLTLEEANENGVKYIFVKCVYRMGPVFGFFGSLQESNWINRSVKAFAQYHKKQKFDLALAQSSTGLGLIKKKHEYDIKVISISHGTIISEYRTFVNSMRFPKDFPLFLQNTGFTIKNFFRRQRDFVHGSNRVIAVSNFVRQALLDETFTDEGRITVINNGVDPALFPDLFKSPPRGNKLIYTGQVIKSKGMEDLLKMFSDPEFKDIELDIFGGGDYLDTMKKMTETNPPLQKVINLAGKVPYLELLKNYYADPQYGIFVFPTKRYEGFPMVLAEAMFSGLPVVAYNVGGVADAITDGETGFLVKPDDLDNFKDKVLKLVKNQDLRDEFSRSAYQKAHQRFTLQQMLDSYEEVFREVVS